MKLAAFVLALVFAVANVAHGVSESPLPTPTVESPLPTPSPVGTPGSTAVVLASIDSPQRSGRISPVPLVLLAGLVFSLLAVLVAQRIRRK